jgi:hypothetical protein
MSELRRSDRKRTQTGSTRAVQGRARLAREAAIDSAYEPLGGLKQLGAAGGGEGSVWVGAQAAPHLL